MRKMTKAGLGALGAAALLAGLAGPALADAGAQATDFVAVGSDTVQNAANFLFDGDQNSNPGFNFGNKSTRIFSFDANGDDTGRAVYPASSSTSLPVTEILRVGTLPVPRPNGSGAGIAALTADSTGTGQVGYQGKSGTAGYPYPALPLGSINLVRASRLPNATEQSNCKAISGCGGLHVYQFATDNLNAATAVTTNAPTDLTIDQLAHIFQCDPGYTTWNGSGIGGTSSDTVVPVIPQTGSGTRDFFVADMTAALGGTFTLGKNCVAGELVTGQEHDPSSIFGNPTPQDVIMPFSTAKITLINSGYFGSFEQNKIKSNFSSTGYNTPRGLYFIARDYDIANAKKYAPAASVNLFTFLFGGTSPWIGRSSQATLIQSAGLTPNFQDLGDAAA